jgi:hypothetical protein
MVAPGVPEENDTFLEIFGTPTLLWRVLEQAGYREQPRYVWTREYIGRSSWFCVRLVIPACTWAPFWQAWRAVAEARNPWEAAQVVALDVLSQIRQTHGDALANSAAGTIPPEDPGSAVWTQPNGNPLIRDRMERAQSSGPAMSTMFAVMQAFAAREDSYATCVDQLKQAEVTCRQLAKRV